MKYVQLPLYKSSDGRLKLRKSEKEEEEEEEEAKQLGR